MKFKIDQIAILVESVEEFSNKISDVFSAKDEWVRDDVRSDAWLYDKGHKSGSSVFDYSLAFNYDLLDGGLEFELIEKNRGLSFHDHLRPPCISHFGTHVEDLGKAIKYFDGLGYDVVQINRTKDHTGTNRKYAYAFVDTRPLLGYYLKIIRRKEE